MITNIVMMGNLEVIPVKFSACRICIKIIIIINSGIKQLIILCV
jgi:hypothetical protein